MAKPQAPVTRRPENLHPVDALSVLNQKMLHPWAYGSCAPHVPGECQGCPAFDDCERSTKGTGRPVNGGVRISKQGGLVREDVMTCYGYWSQKESKEKEGILLDWIAEEGEEITIRGSRPLNRLPNGQPSPNTAYEDFYEVKEVPEFKGIAANPKLIGAAYQAALFQKHHEKKKQEKRDQTMAPPPGSVVPGETSADEKPKRR